MSAIYYTVLLVLLIVMLLIASPNLRQFAAVGLCFWLFIGCLILSGGFGIFGGIWLAGHILPTKHDGSWYVIPPALLALPLTMPFVSVLTFYISYFCVALSVVRVVEKRQKIELGKPGRVAGVVLSVLSPFFMWPFYIHIFYPHG